MRITWCIVTFQEKYVEENLSHPKFKMTESTIANSQEYQSFRSSVPLKTVSIHKKPLYLFAQIKKMHSRNWSIESNKVQCCSYSAVVLLKIKFFQYIVDDDESKEWKLYDAGPKQVKCPLVCFPPASGTADVFYKQVLALSAVGFRVISVRVTFV